MGVYEDQLRAWSVCILPMVMRVDNARLSFDRWVGCQLLHSTDMFGSSRLRWWCVPLLFLCRQRVCVCG